MSIPLEPQSAEERASPTARCVTLRAVTAAAVLTVLAGFWIRESEIVAQGVYLTESVPTIPAVAALLVVLALNGALRRTRFASWVFVRGEMLFIFLFVCVATTMFSCGTGRFLLALLTSPFYFAQAGNRLGEAQKHIPDWAAVHDTTAIKHFYESVRGEPIPWGEWATPLVAWGGFLLALWLAMMCLVMLLHRPWIEKEKLSFPLIQLPLEITDSPARPRGIPAFFRNPVMWAGFSLSFAYNMVNILHALVPSFPQIGRYVSFQPFTTPPWDAMGWLTLQYRPELIGFGYLVSAEISFSVWATFLLERLVGVFLSATGYREPGMPYVQEQAIGAYIAIALLLIYLGRHHLAAIARAAVSGGEPEMRRYRTAFWGFWASLAALLLFCRQLGMQWWVGLAYLGVFMAVALTYARMRAETGIPLIWLFPYGMPKPLLFWFFGTAPFSPGGDPSTLTALAMLSFLSRGFFVGMAGYQVEALRAAHQLSEKPRRIVLGLTLALVMGVALAFLAHLSGYYRGGAQQVRGGIWGSGIANVEYDNAINWAASPRPADRARTVAALAGFGTAALLQLARTRIVGFPLHPLGFAASNAYGSLLWSPFFVVWLAKVLVLRFGGMDLYRKTLPGFLGFALGHFFTAGIVWGTIGAFGKQLYEGYMVFFG
ncbi:MAG: hypothetical protein HY321_03665 [Armatimonadetes bacterium]|nr:hypothetical protein [Armatimonadota bacterium]